VSKRLRQSLLPQAAPVPFVGRPSSGARSGHPRLGRAVREFEAELQCGVYHSILTWADGRRGQASLDLTLAVAVAAWRYNCVSIVVLPRCPRNQQTLILFDPKLFCHRFCLNFTDLAKLVSQVFEHGSNLFSNNPRKKFDRRSIDVLLNTYNEPYDVRSQLAQGQQFYVLLAYWNPDVGRKAGVAPCGSAAASS